MRYRIDEDDGDGGCVVGRCKQRLLIPTNQCALQGASCYTQGGLGKLLSPSKKEYAVSGKRCTAVLFLNCGTLDIKSMQQQQHGWGHGDMAHGTWVHQTQTESYLYINY